MVDRADRWDRRKFLGGAALAGTAGVVAPAPPRPKPTRPLRRPPPKPPRTTAATVIVLLREPVTARGVLCAVGEPVKNLGMCVLPAYHP